MSISLMELAREERPPDRETWRRWGRQGLVLTEKPERGPRTVPAHEVPLARLAARLFRAGVQTSAIAALLAGLRECPVEDRRSKFAESILLRLSEGSWVFMPSLSALPQPGQVLGALLVGELV